MSKEIQLTPLNIATTLLYDQCDGKHVPSDKIVERGSRVMVCCARCEVPYREIVNRWTAVVG